jgi:hypothetical protein
MPASLWLCERDARGRFSRFRRLPRLHDAALVAVETALACPGCGARRDVILPDRPGNPAVLVCSRPARECGNACPCDPAWARLACRILPAADLRARVAAQEREARRFPLFRVSNSPN